MARSAAWTLCGRWSTLETADLSAGGRVDLGAHSSRRAKRTRLLLVELGIAIAATACGTNDARPEATSGTVTAPSSGAAPTAEVMRLFDYDRQRPLAVTKLGGTTGRLPAQALDGITVEAITYASPKGGEVPALVVVPKGRGPFAGVIVQHGLPSTKEDFLPLGVDLARTGAVAILIDAPFNRPQQGRVRGDISLTPRDRDEQIQLIVDLRRAVDLLTVRPDVDRRRLAYAGVSYGAAMGGLLAGVEDRITAYMLAVGDGGLVSHFTGPDDTDGPLQRLAAADRERWLAAMRPIEPINFIGQAAPAALLFQAGTMDEAIPQEDARRYQQAASQPKEIRWYEAGHMLNCTAGEDMMAWLGRHIRINPTQYTCQP
jgi:dienelactone hydrolase